MQNEEAMKPHPRSSPRAQGRVTIYDVARHVGVSPSTASRALHKPGRLNANTEAKIRAAAAELGFKANPAARALPTGRTRAIALLVADITNPFVFNVILGAERAAEAAGYVLVTSEFREDRERESSRVESLVPAVDGFVLAMSRLTDERIADITRERPVATINRASSSAISEIGDYESSLREMVRELASLGHRTIAYLGGPAESWVNARRWEAVCEEAAAHGIKARAFGPNPPTRDAGAAALTPIRKYGATAVMAYNDIMAIGFMGAALTHGIAIPDNMSVVGVDDIFGSDFTTPPLTTIAAPLDDMGTAAVVHLLEEIDGRTPTRETRYPTHIVWRGSTGPAPHTDGP